MGNSVDTLTEDMQHMTLDTTLSHLTKPDSEWGSYQHPCTQPFLKPGIVLDLETFWARGWSNTYIQQIGACPIGMNKNNFELLCDLPHQHFDTVEGMYQWFLDIQLDPKKSIACWKKVLKVRTDETVVRCLTRSREWWKGRHIEDFSYKRMEQLIFTYSTVTRFPLIFPLEYALRFFLNYAKDAPAWYAHNGNRFDFPIVEQNFNRYNINYSCVPKNPNTTAMGTAFRLKHELPMKQHQIDCYDTMLMFRNHPESKYARIGHGAKRVSQGKQVGEQDGKIVWANGSRTKNIYSYKLQDIINDVGMKANHCTAHTALADCLTLRECLYRVFSKQNAAQAKEKAKQFTKMTLHRNIIKRLK